MTMSDMNESMDTGDQPLGSSGRGDFLMKAAIDRRVMLKGAVAAGVFAGTWVAPHIETFGFAPAFAATMCTVTNDEKKDLQSNDSNNTYVSPGHTSCGQSFGSSSAAAPDTITILDPTSTCASYTVRTQPQDCVNAPPAVRYDPDASGFVVVPYQSSGTCDCTITSVFVFKPGSTRANPDFTFTSVTNGTPGCPTGSSTGGPTGPGIKVDLPCLAPKSRLAVQITCSTTGHC